MTLWSLIIYNDILHRSDFKLHCRTWPFTKLREVYMEHVQLGHYSEHLVLSHSGLLHMLYLSSGGVVVKLWLDEQEFQGSIPGLTAMISEICYLLLPIRDMAEISLKGRKSSKPPLNLLYLLRPLLSPSLSWFSWLLQFHHPKVLSQFYLKFVIPRHAWSNFDETWQEKARDYLHEYENLSLLSTPPFQPHSQALKWHMYIYTTQCRRGKYLHMMHCCL